MLTRKSETKKVAPALMKGTVAEQSRDVGGCGGREVGAGREARMQTGFYLQLASPHLHKEARKADELVAASALPQ